MSTVQAETPVPTSIPAISSTLPASRPAGLRRALAAEWVKLRTVRSTMWTLLSLFALGVGLTVLICWANAEWLASAEADESPGSFVTWGMMFAQIPALVLGVLVVTSEYARGLIGVTVAAVPRRGLVVAAKSLVLLGVLFVVAMVTAVLGYLGGNWFLDQEGIGLALGDEGVQRALLGCGLYAAVLGLFGAALGLLLRSTAGAVTLGISLIFVFGNLVMLVPGAFGDWLTKLMPGNAGSSIAMVQSFNPDLLDPWTGFAVFCAETAVLLGIATVRFIRRDA
jgi:ABC-2 type transport system permease protein